MISGEASVYTDSPCSDTCRESSGTERLIRTVFDSYVEVLDRSIAESQRLAQAWTAVYSESLRGWAEMLQTSANTMVSAAQAFDASLSHSNTRDRNSERS